MGGVGYYEYPTHCVLVELASEETLSLQAQHPSTCESVELSEIESSVVTDFSEVIHNEKGELPTPYFRQLNKLYSEKFRKLREHDDGSKEAQHTTSHPVIKPFLNLDYE